MACRYIWLWLKIKGAMNKRLSGSLIVGAYLHTIDKPFSCNRNRHNKYPPQPHEAAYQVPD